MHISNVDQVVLKSWNKPDVTSRVASVRLTCALRDKVTRVIIVLFVGGQVTNVEQNK